MIRSFDKVMDFTTSILSDQLHFTFLRLDKRDLALVDPHALILDKALLLLLAIVLRQDRDCSAVKSILLRLIHHVNVRIRHVASQRL